MLKHIKLLIHLSLTLIFICANLVDAQIVKDGLVAYWPLDKNTIEGDIAKDIIGKNDGSIINAKSVAGKIGEALEFNGSNSKVDIKGTDALNFNGKKELTAAAWINIAGHSGSCCDPVVAQRDVNSWALRYDSRNAGAELEFIVCPGWVGDGAGFGIPVPKTGEWHYLVGVCDGKQLLIYLDGELGDKGTIAFPGTISGNGSATTIGGASDGYFKGIIDDVLIYNRALSENEIKQNYKSKGLIAVDSKEKLSTCWGYIKDNY
ncbi:MAG: LamG domain-containing protein [bacterium]